MRNKNYTWMNKEDLWKEDLWTKGYDSFKAVLLKSINKIIKSNLIWLKWVNGWVTEGRKRERKQGGREGIGGRKGGRNLPSCFGLPVIWSVEGSGNQGGCLLASHVPVTCTVPGREALAQEAVKWLPLLGVSSILLQLSHPQFLHL